MRTASTREHLRNGVLEGVRATANRLGPGGTPESPDQLEEPGGGLGVGV
jgi:hypothetical protein